MREFLWGVLTTLSVAISCFLARFWRDTRDRLFLFFAGAFAILGLSWAMLLFLQSPIDDSPHLSFPLRLVAFILIAIAIIDKNRRPGA